MDPITSTTGQLQALAPAVGLTPSSGAALNGFGYVQGSGDPAPTGTTGSYSGGTAAPQVNQAQLDTIAYLNDQANNLRGLLGRTDTAYNSGMGSIGAGYNHQVDVSTANHTGQVQGQNSQKQSTMDTIRQNAGNAYHSLAQIIGRASGTGSSAYQELLPNVVGTDTSRKSQATSDTYGTNIANIDTSFQNVLQDLANQKKQNESDLSSKVEAQRQSLNNELATNAGQLAQAQGGGYDAVRAAQQPYQDAINNSRNAVESLATTYAPSYTAPLSNPDLQNYTTDRSTINAQNSGDGTDPTNPYAALLRKKLQGAA